MRSSRDRADAGSMIGDRSEEAGAHTPRRPAAQGVETQQEERRHRNSLVFSLTISARPVPPFCSHSSLLLIHHVTQQLNQAQQRLGRLIRKVNIILCVATSATTQEGKTHMPRGRASRKSTRAKSRILMTACWPFARSMALMRLASAATLMVRTLT